MNENRRVYIIYAIACIVTNVMVLLIKKKVMYLIQIGNGNGGVYI